MSDANPHDVASVLKEFFRSLPEPLMTRELYQAFLATRSEQGREGGREGERERASEGAREREGGREGVSEEEK